jgi:hypothetical protein
MPIGLVERRPAQPFGLASIDVEAHRRIVPGWSAYGRLSAVQGDQQHRRRPTATAHLPYSFQGAFGRFRCGGGHRHFERVLAVADEQRLWLKAALSRQCQRP